MFTGIFHQNTQPQGIDLAFCSGMSSKSDLHGAMDASIPVGVVAGELTTCQTLLSLPRYMDKGGYVFVDSGAFTAFKSGETIDWEDVLHKYEMLADLTTATKRLYVVAPDVVGSQEGTLALINQYKNRINQLVEYGVKVICPLQHGEMPANNMLNAIKGLLGHEYFVAGIPSNRAALPVNECGSLKHHTFHILGRVKINKEQETRIRLLRENNPVASITADANWLRGQLDKVRSATNHEHSRRITTNDPAYKTTVFSARTVAITKLLSAQNMAAQA